MFTKLNNPESDKISKRTSEIFYFQKIVIAHYIIENKNK